MIHKMGVTNDINICYNTLSKKILKRYIGKQVYENVVLSPYSIFEIMALIVESTGGESKQEILKYIFGEYDEEKLNKDINELKSLLNKEETITISNALCLKSELKEKIKKDYAESLEKKYNGKLFCSDNLIRSVNEWVKERTQGRISTIVDDTLNGIIACFVNAITFDAYWKSPCWDDNVTQNKFNNSDGSSSMVNMMNCIESYYIEDRSFTGFIKPYYHNQYCYMALLPKKKNNDAIDKAIDNIDLSQLYYNAETAEVHVIIPEYEYSYGNDMKTLIESLGIKQIFSSEGNFTPLMADNLMIDSIIHKANIKVDRVGTKAAAATVAEVEFGSVPQKRRKKKVYLDRSFLYAIIHKETGIPLFIGRVNRL